MIKRTKLELKLNSLREISNRNFEKKVNIIMPILSTTITLIYHHQTITIKIMITMIMTVVKMGILLEKKLMMEESFLILSKKSLKFKRKSSS